MDISIFDKYSDFYGDVNLDFDDYYFANFIRKKQKKQGLNLLDIGGGSGRFAHLVKDVCPDIDVFVVDPSKKLLDKIDDERIKKIRGKLPDQIFLDSVFDYVHVKDVFHHIVGSSIDETKELLRKSLYTIRDLLGKEGFLLIYELFYESYLIPTLCRTSIFYLLALQNRLKINVPAKEFLMNLEVCFYTRPEFKSILNDCGFTIVDFHEKYWNNTFKKRLLFLQNWGIMLFIVKKVL